MNDESVEAGSVSGTQLRLHIEMQLVMEEYKSTRSILEKNIDIMERTEILSIGAVASAVAFSISQNESDLFIYSAIIPVFIAILGYMRFVALGQTIAIYNAYLLRYEACYQRLGMTKFFQDSRDRIKSDKWVGWSLLSSRKVTLGAVMASSVFYLSVNLFKENGNLNHLNLNVWLASLGISILVSLTFSFLHFIMLKSAKRCNCSPRG